MFIQQCHYLSKQMGSFANARGRLILYMTSQTSAKIAVNVSTVVTLGKILKQEFSRSLLKICQDFVAQIFLVQLLGTAV